jgi:hypothetical protein
MLSATSTPWAPWYVVPADRKWFARICVSAILAHTLIQLDPRYPTVGQETLRKLDEAKAELEAEAPAGAARDPVAADLAAHHNGQPSRKHKKQKNARTQARPHQVGS